MQFRWRAFARILLPAAVILLLGLIAGCDSGDPANTFANDGEVSRRIRDLFIPILWIAMIIFVLVEGTLLFFLFKFRERRGAPLPKQLHGNTRLELAWTIAPTLLMAGVAVPTLITLFDLSHVPDNAMEVTITGNQWWWRMDYPGQQLVTANELHIPTGRAVKVTLESNDVIHSFWVPRLAGKQDVVPGHTRTMWLKADEVGTYFGQCAEYCGLSHALMRLHVVAQSPQEFDQWVADQKRPAAAPTATLAQQGAQKFSTTCAVCHTIAGTNAAGEVGPNLTHFASRGTLASGIMDRTDENLAKWLKDPPAIKPGSRMPSYNLTDQEINGLVAYLQSLK